MRIACLGLLALALALATPANIAAQGLDGLTGSWALDRAVSTFGPGDPGAERVDILVSATEVRVTRFFDALPEASVWTFALDGSAPPPPKRGSALVIDGKLVITQERALEVVTHAYTVEGDTLRVERSIQAKSNRDGQALKRVMVFRRSI
jgi:hypothetical protein